MNLLLVTGAVIEASHPAGERFVLRIPHLAAGPGDRIALVGPSGAGKSTTLEFLALLRRPEELATYMLPGGGGSRDVARELLTGSLDLLARRRAADIGYVPQSGGLLPFVSARENALTCVRAAGRPVDLDVRFRVDHWMSTLGLDRDLDKRRGQLSGGERKRVAVLRALAIPRSLLLVDEPTAGLDETNAEMTINALCRACRDDATICVVAMHDVDRALRHGFRPVPVEKSRNRSSSTVGGTEAEHLRPAAAG